MSGPRPGRASLAAAVLAAGCALAVAATRTVAQETDTVPVSPPAVEEEVAPAEATARPGRQIQEIVVTAQKREEMIQDVPISMTAFTGDFLKEAGVDNLHQLAQYTSNVRFTTNACCTTVFIRGFGTPFAASAFDPTVGLALDELSIPKEVYMSDPFYDTQRFEVLRGPQGTLFGKNTPAGLFNVTTTAPGDEFSGYVLGRIGSLDMHRAEAAIGGPLPGNFGALRVAAVDLKQPGDVHNTALDVDEPATKQHAARVRYDIEPVEGLDVALIGSTAKTDSRYFHIQNFGMRDATREFVQQYDPRFEDDPFDHQNSINLERGIERTTDLLQANVRYAFDDRAWVKDASVIAVVGDTGFDSTSGFDVDFSPVDVANLNPTIFDYDQQSAELRFAGTFAAPFGLGEIEALAGFLTFRSDLHSESDVTAGRDFVAYLLSPAGYETVTGMPPPGGISFANITEVTDALGLPSLSDVALLEGDGGKFLLRQKLKSNAGFGQIAWHFTEAWTASFGFRYTKERKKGHLVNDCFTPGVVCAALMIEEFDLDLERTETDFSPKFTIQYFPWDGLALFATRGQGFKSGGYNNFSFTADALDVEPEKTVSYEVGAKGTALDGSLSYALVFFDMTAKDLQLQTLVGASVLVRNAASANSRGVELEGQWLTPWEPLSVSGSAAYTRGRFREFENAPAPASSPDDTQDLSGRRLPFSPKLQFALIPRLEFPVGTYDWPYVPKWLVFTTALDILYRSAAYLDIDLDPNTRQESYTLLNGRIVLSNAAGTVSLVGSVNNILDEDALEYATDSLLYPGGFVSMQEFQRTYGVELHFSF
ncbi:MAG TPA: TonB-dependent receptor [Nevskiaceae bacterium]|nr:TonB-dependent receptor [Nevskiaceae bacterium]